MPRDERKKFFFLIYEQPQIKNFGSDPYNIRTTLYSSLTALKYISFARFNHIQNRMHRSSYKSNELHDFDQHADLTFQSFVVIIL